MIKQLKNNRFLNKKYLCIQINGRDGVRDYSAIEVVKQGDLLTIVNTYTGKDLAGFCEQLPKKFPVLLALTGQGIIAKKVKYEENYQSKLLFNADPEEFYWYPLAQDGQLFVSVVRKTMLQEGISDFEKHGFSIVDVGIGPFLVAAIKPLLGTITCITTSNFDINFTKGKISDFAKKVNFERFENYKMGEETITSNTIVPFSLVVNYLFPNPEILADISFLASRREEYFYKKMFNTVGMIALPLFLLTLLLSYLLLGHYQQKYIELQVNLGEQNVAYNKLQLLENDKTNKAAILTESGLNDSNFLSYYISEIGKDIPSEISLLSLKVFPVTEKIKPEERIEFSNDLVEIEGTAVGNKAFSDWIQELKKMKWIANIEIVDFSKKGGENSFELRLILRFDV